MLASNKIIFFPTSLENLSTIIKIEKENSNFVGQYDLDRHKKVISDNNEGHYSFFDKSDNSLIGYAILAGLTMSDYTIEFRRIVIARKGHGYGKEAVTIVKKICFEKYKAKKLWLDVYVDNLNAITLYERLGFVKEEMIEEKGTSRSMWIMSISSSRN